MRIGIIGYGSIGVRHFQNLKRLTRDIVIFTKRRDVHALPVANTWNQFCERGPFDAIFITNETHKHLKTIQRCLPLQPRAFFVEKPISHTISGLSSLGARLRKKNISCWVGYNLHFFTPLLKVRKILKRGQLGKLYALRVSVGQDLREWRTRDYRSSYSGHARKGGGVTLDLIHDLNYPAWLLNERLYPVAALARKVSALQITTEDCAESLLRTRSGIMVSLHQDYVRIPGKRSLEIIAERGTLEWDTLTNTLHLWVHGTHRKEKVLTDRNDMYKAEIHFFLKQLASKKYFSNLDEAIHDVTLTHALKRLR